MTVFQYSTGSAYFGVEHLNLHSRSSNNFSPDDLRKIVEILKKLKTTCLCGAKRHLQNSASSLHYSNIWIFLNR